MQIRLNRGKDSVQTRVLRLVTSPVAWVPVIVTVVYLEIRTSIE
jgi:hypothetical protein